METKEALQLLHKSFTEKFAKYDKLSKEQEDNIDLLCVFRGNCYCNGRIARLLQMFY